jgi:hypothetical protein
MIQHIQEECGLDSVRENPTVIYEDNTACIAQIKKGYIKGDRTKHISSKFFSTHDLQNQAIIWRTYSQNHCQEIFLSSFHIKLVFVT